MAPSLRDHSTSLRPATRDRPSSREQPNVEPSLIVPSRTSSLHSRITQPIPSTLNVKPAQRTPKTLTHAYMVCGVGREPSQWVKAPPPVQGKVGHMKGAVGQFWLPEILGSSPRLEQDNEIARVLHSAMRVRLFLFQHHKADRSRHAFLMMSKSVSVVRSLTASTIPLSCSRILRTRSMELVFESGPVRTKRGPKPFVTFERGPSRTFTTILTRRIGFRTA